MISATNTLTTRAFFLLAGLVLCASAQGAAVNTKGQDLVPTGKGWGELPDPGRKSNELADFPDLGAFAGKRKPRGLITRNGINYHGGPVMLGTTNVYYIWYGDWTGNSGTSILTDLAQYIGGSPYYNINTTYFNGSNVRIANAVAHGGSTADSYSKGTALSDADIHSIVSNAIESGDLPNDINGVYFVLTSADVTATSGFCTQYCGWHSHGTIGGSDVKYSFVGNPDRCPSSCASQTVGPNSNAGADGMASIIAHELEEAVTDPDLNGWYDRSGYENADKCVWKYGSTYTTANGAKANMKLGNRDYLIQQNWVNAKGGYCASSF